MNRAIAITAAIIALLVGGYQVWVAFQLSHVASTYSDDLDFLVTSPVPGESTIYLYPSRESLRPRYGNTTTERPIFPSGGHGETDEDIVTRNSRRGSKFVRKTRQ